MIEDNEEVIDEEIEEAPSLRESLEAAVEEHSDEADDFDEPMHTTEDKSTEEAKADEPVEQVKADEGGENSENNQQTPPSNEKPPLDWGPEVREEWKKLPDSVKNHLHARDQHVNTMLRDGAEHRKMGQGLAEIAQPYAAIMQAEGVSNPLQAVDGLFKTVGALRMGTQADKAQTIARLVNVYGVDINALDNALVGNTEALQQDPVEAMIDKRMAPVNALLGQINQNRTQQEQQEQARINGDIGQFSQTAEFFEDVRHDMADFMDMAAQHGKPMTLQQAYDKACALNPEISGVIAKRASDEALLRNSRNMANKNNAASSIRSNSSPNGAATHDNSSIRGAIMNAFDEHT